MKTPFNIIVTALLIAVITFTIIGCKKSDVYPAPQISLSVTADTTDTFMGDTLELRAIVANSVAIEHTWTINDSVYSKAYNIVFYPPAKGLFLLTYRGGNMTASYERRMIIRVTDRLRPVTAASSRYISKVVEYLPAPGQFVNDTLAGRNIVQNIIGDNRKSLNLGGFGGYVVFTFDHSLINSNGMDLGIYSSPLPPPAAWSKPGIVMVSHDRNGNGLADDAWYELAGSEYNNRDTKKNYTVTYYNPKAYKDVPWKDNTGDTGFIYINNQHLNNYYPLFAANQDSISFQGNRLPDSFTDRDSTFINTGFAFGYADNYSISDNPSQTGYNSFDISWAT
ncbi:MAG: PKD domain-containing protein, partial [Chitinophagaceae bacterium]